MAADGDGRADAQDGDAARVRAILGEASALHARMQALDPAPIVSAARLCLDALRAGRKVLAFGNGGSAAEAQHFAAELSGRFARERRALAALALTTDSSAITAIGNDYGFDRIFARQVEALGQPGDVAVGISTSGRSANVLAALATARERGLHRITLTGDRGGEMAALADVHIGVPGTTTARVQEVQLTVLHAICDLVEQAIAADDERARG